MLITRKFPEQEVGLYNLLSSPGLLDATVANVQSYLSNKRHSGWAEKGIILFHDAFIWTSASGPDANNF